MFENFLYFYEVLYTLVILEYRLLLILTVVVSTLTILSKTECNFFWFPLNFSKASTTRGFFNGNGCFDILTVHCFINMKNKYLPDMLNMEIETRNIWMFLKMVLNSMYMWTSYKAFPSLKKNKCVLNAHETKPYKINKRKPHYCCSSSWNHCKPSTMKITCIPCSKFQMSLIINFQFVHGLPVLMKLITENRSGSLNLWNCIPALV